MAGHLFWTHSGRYEDYIYYSKSLSAHKINREFPSTRLFQYRGGSGTIWPLPMNYTDDEELFLYLRLTYNVCELFPKDEWEIINHSGINFLLSKDFDDPRILPRAKEPHTYSQMIGQLC